MTDAQWTFESAAYGVRYRFTAESSLLLDRMKECAPWSGGEHLETLTEALTIAEFELSRSGEQFRLLRAGAAITCEENPEDILERLAGETVLHVAEHAPDLVFVHAGVVGWQGRALVLPGRSFAGKSTLVAALVRAGAAYYSDEYALIDLCGRVHPYARALQLREPGSLEQRPVTVEELEGSAGAKPMPVTHVVFSEFAGVESTWNPEALSPGKAVLAMMEHSIAVQRVPDRVMATLAKVMERAKAIRSDRGDAKATAEVLLLMMSEENGG